MFAPRRTLAGVAGLLVLVTSPAAPAGAPEAPWSAAIESLPTPAGTPSAQPQLTVEGERVILSWIERDGARATLKFAERAASGWSAARTVVSGDDFFVNWADVPSVRALGGGRLAAHWLQKSGPGTYAYDVRLAFSSDGGRSWSAPVSPHHDGTPTEHGFASLYQAPGAGLGLVWLDGRAMKPDAGHGHGGGDMSLRAAVFGEDGVQRSEVVVDDRVCECCPTAAAQTSEGILVAYRNRSADEVRDIFVSRLVSGAWTPPVPVHEDGWRIPGCPVNGPAVSASGRRVALAWFTVQEDRGRAFVAFSADAGRTFAPPVRVDDAMAIGRLDVELLDDGGAAVGWVEHAGERSQFRVRRIQPDGTRSASIVVAGLASGRTSGYPRLARHGRDLLFAWTEAGPASRVVTARAQLSESVSSRQ